MFFQVFSLLLVAYSHLFLRYPLAKGDDSMDSNFVRERITQLRLQKGVSEYKMSYDLGHSRGYINNISSAFLRIEKPRYCRNIAVFG